MNVASAVKYIKKSTTWAFKILEQFAMFLNFDLSNSKSRKRITSEEQDNQVVHFASAAKPMTSQQIAKTIAKRGIEVSHDIVNRRLKEHKCR